MARQDFSRRFTVDTGSLVLHRDPDAAGTWVLELDGHRQSSVDLDDPTHLGFDYMRRLGHVVDLLAPERAPIDAVHLGGGGLTLARYIAVTRPGSRQRVFEIDAALTEVVRTHLPLPADARIRVGTIDAFAGLASLRDASADLVVLDVFADGRIPAHLTSEAVVPEARRVLRPGGVYAVNVVDLPPLNAAKAHIAAVEAGFVWAAAIVQTSRLRTARHGNVVVVGSDTALPTEALAQRATRDRHPGRVLTGPSLRHLR